jgi:hypothetical protein
MNEAEIVYIEGKLKIDLPHFYIQTMVEYPFSSDSFASEFTLCTDVGTILDCCSVLASDNKYAVGHDGGEYIYYIKLTGEESVYIHDIERSKAHNSVVAESWSDFLECIEKEEEEIKQDELLTEERRASKKWWQFWI